MSSSLTVNIVTQQYGQQYSLTFTLDENLQKIVISSKDTVLHSLYTEDIMELTGTCSDPSQVWPVFTNCINGNITATEDQYFICIELTYYHGQFIGIKKKIIVLTKISTTHIPKKNLKLLADKIDEKIENKKCELNKLINKSSAINEILHQ